MIDIHTHILYGVDDGASTFEESMAMLKMEEALGIDTVYLTPHYIHGKTDYELPELRDKMQKLQTKTNIKLILGNELLYSPFIVEDLKTGKAQTMGNSRYVLVEFNYHASANSIYEGCRTLYNAGYRVILAHIERYNCFNSELAERLKKLEVLFQMNFGFYSEVLKYPFRYMFYKKLLKNGDIKFIASDAHSTSNRKPNIDIKKLDKYPIWRDLGEINGK